MRRSNSALRSGGWAAADQIVFSTGNFLTAVLVGRWAGPAELGVYSLIFSCILLSSAFQRALVTSPYTFLSQKWSSRRRSAYRGSALVHALSISFVGGLLLAIIIPNTLAASNLYFSAVAGAALMAWSLQDFCRRILFADHRFRDALFLDSFTVTTMISSLLILIKNEQLTAMSAVLSLALASVCAVIVWFAFNLQHFSLQSRRILHDFRRNWSFGRWGAMSEVTVVSQELGVQSLLAASGGIAITGAYSACMSMIRIANPFVQAVGNAIGPIGARALASGGVDPLVAAVKKVSWLMLAAMTAYLAIIVFAGKQLFFNLYGERFLQHSDLLVPLALALATTAMGLAPAKAISTLKIPRLNLWSNLASLTVTLLLAWGTYERFDVYGVAFSVLIGATTTSVLKWIFFRKLSKSMQVAGE